MNADSLEVQVALYLFLIIARSRLVLASAIFADKLSEYFGILDDRSFCEVNQLFIAKVDVENLEKWVEVVSKWNFSLLT